MAVTPSPLLLTEKLRPPHGIGGVESELIDLSPNSSQWSIVVPFGANASEKESFLIALADLQRAPFGAVLFERRAVTKSGVLFVATALLSPGDSSDFAKVS